MPKIFNRNFYKPFNTNSGFCFLFWLENKTQIFATSDTKKLNEKILQGKELFVGQKIELDNQIYEIMDIKATPNFNLNFKLSIAPSGTAYQYNFVLNFTLRPFGI